MDYHTAYQVDTNAKQAQSGANRLSTILKSTVGSNWREKLPQFPVIPNNALNSSAVKAPSKPAEVKKVPLKKEERATKPVCEDSSQNEQKCKPAIKEKEKVVTKNAEKCESVKKVENPRDAKRETIKGNVFDKLKDDGNKFVKAGNYQKAIDCYNK